MYADPIRDEIEAAGVEAVIPAKSNRRVPIRYDKTRESTLGFVALASIKLWIPLSTRPGKTAAQSSLG